MAKRSPDKLSKAATGNIEKKNLTEDGGIISTFLYDGPLYQHLLENEQPEYIFKNLSNGYRITEPDGNERTPHHGSSEGRRYLLVTDQRMLYVAGCKDGDDIIEHNYDEISGVEQAGSSDFEFYTTDGTTYKFSPVQAKQTVNEAIEYISMQIPKKSETGAEEHDVTEGSSTGVDDNNSAYEGETQKASLSTWGIRIKIGDESTKIGGKTKSMSTLMVTDMRIVASSPHVEGGRVFSIPIEGISDGELKTASKLNPLNTKLSHTLTLYSDLKYLILESSDSGIERLESDSKYDGVSVEITINFPHTGGAKASESELQDVIDFISKKSEEFRNVPHRSKIFEYLDKEEELETVTKGKKLGIIQGEQTEEEFAGRGIYTAITDKRVVIIVGQVLSGDNIRSIAYDSIDGVDIDDNRVIDFLRIHSGSRTYKINIYDTDQGKKAADYIRKQVGGPQEVVTQSELDEESSNEETEPSEKLRELKSLHEDGILTDEEFELKKEELLDEF